jgi:hypothetical protein
MKCFLCGAEDHAVVYFSGMPILICPLAPKDIAIAFFNPTLFEEEINAKVS